MPRPSLEARFWSKVDRRGEDECWPWTAAVRRADEGYGAFWFNGRHVPASRMAYTLANGEPDSENVVCHRCDYPPCCNPRHLFEATQTANNDDKIAKNRDAVGVRHGNARLTPDQIHEIRDIRNGITKCRREHPASYESLAARYGVSRAYIGEIVRNETRRRG